MWEASQRGRAKGGSAYGERMEPTLESCVNPEMIPAHGGKCGAHRALAAEMLQRMKYSVHRR